MATIARLFRRPRGGSFEELLAPHVEPLYRLAFRFCGNRTDAEDLVQDLIIKIFPHRTELARMAHPRAWLVRVLHNLFLDSRRRAGRDPLTDAGGDDVLDALEDFGAGPERDADQAVLQRRLHWALQQLSPEQRSLIALHDIEDYTLPELQDLLETPIGTLKSRLHRARARLRGLLAAEPFSVERRLWG